MSRIVPVLWLLLADTILGACIGILALVLSHVSCAQANAEPDPCWLAPGVIPRIAPKGMDNYMWPPCDPPGVTTWNRTTMWSQECQLPQGNPDGSMCWYTNPANGKRYLRWGFHARPSEDILLPTDLDGPPCAAHDISEQRTICGK